MYVFIWVSVPRTYNVFQLQTVVHDGLENAIKKYSNESSTEKTQIDYLQSEVGFKSSAIFFDTGIYGNYKSGFNLIC